MHNAVKSIALPTPLCIPFTGSIRLCSIISAQSNAVKTSPYFKCGNWRETMKLLALLYLMTSSVVWAEPPPPVPPEGLVHYKNEACVDPVWGLAGICYYSHDVRGNYYIAFYDERNICMFIMKRIDGEYKELWRRSADT